MMCPDHQVGPRSDGPASSTDACCAGMREIKCSLSGCSCWKHMQLTIRLQEGHGGEARGVWLHGQPRARYLLEDAHKHTPLLMMKYLHTCSNCKHQQSHSNTF